MKALFLAGGDGMRLMPLTGYLPKPMLPVMGRPLLERTVERLRRCGVEEIILSAHPAQQRLGEQIKSASFPGVSVTYIAEDTPFGAGGAIKNAEHLLDDTFFVIDAGILYDVSLQDMLRHHRDTGALATLAAIRASGVSAATILTHDGDGQLTGIHPHRRPGEPVPRSITPGQLADGHANAGVYLLEPEALEHISAARPLSAEREVFPTLLETGKTLVLHLDDSYHRKLSTPLRYVEAHRDCLGGRCGIAWEELGGGGMFIAASAELHPSVTIDKPVYIGENAVVERQCTLRGDVTVGDGAHIGNNCSLADAIIWPGANVPCRSRLHHTVAAEVNGELAEFPYESLGVEVKERWH